MSRMLVVAESCTGTLEAVVADTERREGTERWFLLGADVVLRVPSDVRTVTRPLAARPRPAPRWSALRQALTASTRFEAQAEVCR